MKKPKPEKRKIGIDEEFENMVDRLSKDQGNEALRQLIGDCARASAELTALMKADLQVQEAKYALDEAKAQYTEGIKANKNKIAFVHNVLSARGDAVKM